MNERKNNEIKQAIDGELSGVGRDPFLYQRVLSMSREETPRRRSRKLTAALVMATVLMLSTAVAVATNWTGVRWFLTDRLSVPVDVQDAYIVHPVAQSFESDYIDVTVMDAYWYADTSCDKLAITLHVESKDPERPLSLETAIGNDGENFDLIWQHGEVIPVTQWLNGHEGCGMWISGDQTSLDYVWEDTGITLMMEIWNAPDCSDGVTLESEVSVWPIRLDDSELGFSQIWDETETKTLTFTLPPMTRGPEREIDFANEPNG